MAGAIMVVFGCLGKVSALAVSMPDPIVGASFLILFGMPFLLFDCYLSKV